MSEHEPYEWIKNAESISKIVPIGISIVWRNEFNKRDSTGKTIYSNEDKRRLLLEDESLSAAQKQEIDKAFINDITIIPKDTFADYTSIENFELSLLSGAKQTAYEDFKLESKISKSKYAFAVDAVTDAKIESVKAKDGKTIPNSKGLLIRELIDGLEDLTDAEKKAIYEAMGVGKTVAGMGTAEFKRELNSIKKYID